jgi:hypothetical protein
MSRPDVASLRGAAWALGALTRLRHNLRSAGISAAAVVSPPELPDAALRGVEAVLRRRHATCLERSLVLQKWFYARGIRCDVVLGVTAPGDGFAAHAWLDGEADERDRFHELARLLPR